MLSDRPRCPTHDLALDPSGACVLCRRTVPPAPQRTSPIIALAIGSLLLVGAVAGVTRWMRAPAEVIAPSVVPEPSTAAPPPSLASTIPRRTRHDVRDLVPSSEPLAAVAPPPPPTSAAPVETGPSQAALTAARRRVSITMYSTSWCGVCAQARAYLGAHHISYTEHDVEHSERYARLLHELNPRGSVPTFDIDDQVLVGFGPDSFEHMIDAAALEHVR